MKSKHIDINNSQKMIKEVENHINSKKYSNKQKYSERMTEQEQ